MVKVKEFAKREIVMLVSLVLAMISLFFVKPGPEYAGYIDCRTLGILLSLMLVVAGLRGLGVFAVIGQMLIDKTRTARGLALVFVLLNFFLSMVITNDVALLTFVPFAMEVLVMSHLEKYTIPVVVLETIAANLGSMLTPIGNPHNLYLYSTHDMSMMDFVRVTLPYSMVSLLFLVIATVALIGAEPTGTESRNRGQKRDKKWMVQLVGYLLLFAACMLTVLRVVPYLVTLGIVIAGIACMDRGTLKKADYCLLFTFVFLFVFVGNLARIPAISQGLMNLTRGNEVLVAVGTSQVISNVPATILLAGFTDNISDLIIGVNIGGLGTLIASMASLISFKCYCRDENSRAGRYIGFFTLLNLVFLAVLLGLHYMIR